MAEEKEKVYEAEEIKDNPLPTPETASRMKGSFFDTIGKWFTGIFKIAPKGGIQIGKYVSGVSGKILIDKDGFKGYDTTDYLRVHLKPTGGMDFYGTSAISFLAGDIGVGYLGAYEGVEGLFGVTLASNAVSGWLNLAAGQSIACHSDLEVGTFTYPTPGWVANFSVDEDTGDTYIAGDLTVDGTITGTVSHAINADHAVDATTAGYADEALISSYLVNTGTAGSQIWGYTDAGTIKFSSDGIVKTAIVPTSKGFRSLYSVESPEVWFMDFCRGFKIRKWPKFWQTEWRIFPSKLFLETIEPPIIAMATLQKGVVQLWGKRKGFEKVRFEKKTKKEFDKNNEFWGQAHIKKGLPKNKKIG